MGEHIHLEHDATSGVATIRLDRPKVNALDDQAMNDLDGICEILERDHPARSVVVWGGPRVFCGGADIDQFLGYGPSEAESFSHRLNDVLLRLERLPQVTISAINGYALGGGLELAMATDFRIAAAGALLGQPEALLGLVPGGGGTQRLTRLVGVTRAKEILYTGGRLVAEDGLAMGLVSAVHEPESLITEALALASSYASGAACVPLIKSAVLDGLHLPLDEAVKMEAARFGEAFATTDARIGLDSFVANGPGKARFTGR